MNENERIPPDFSQLPKQPEEDRLPASPSEAMPPILPVAPPSERIPMTDAAPVPAEDGAPPSAEQAAESSTEQPAEQPAEQTTEPSAEAAPPASGEVTYDSESGEYTTPASPVPIAPPPQKPKKKRTGLKTTLLICLTVILSAGMGIAGGILGALATRSAAFQNPNLNAPVITETVVKVNNAEIGTTSVMQATANAVPSVVVVDTFQSQADASAGKQIGSGSGVIWTADGYIVTCNHVIEGAPVIRVTLSGGTSYFADVVGTDARTDLAVLKIAAGAKLPAVTVRGTELVLAETVVAIGNPLGVLSNTVSEGILSCLTREITVEGQTMSLIQIDAAVNHGNSGGGLFDMNGSLIGIVNAKSTGESVEGIGFAIPINTVMEVSNQLIEFGFVQGRPRLGITVVTVTESNAAYVFEEGYYPELKEYATTENVWGNERTKVIPGVYIYDTSLVAGYVKGSPELKFGDRILYVGNAEVSENADVLAALAGYKAGDEIQITVQRNHKTTVVVNLILGQQGAK